MPRAEPPHCLAARRRYIDQTPEGPPEEGEQYGTGDVGVQLAAEHGVPIYSSINQALCCGGSELAVDGVIMIGEHGDYPWNEKGQHLFPRKYFMEQILGVFASSGRSVPVFVSPLQPPHPSLP